MKRWACVVGAAAVAIIAACSSDNDASKTTTTVNPDAGSSGTTTPEGGSTSVPDSGSDVLGTCFGQPFGTPAAITATLADAGATTKIEDVRVVGMNAYFARTDTGAAPTYLFKAAYADAVGLTTPSLTDSTSVLDPRVGESDLSPAVASDASYIVFSHGEIGGRIIWSAMAGGPGFANGGSANISEGLTDDADPWLAGSPSTRVYFGRGQMDGTAMHIVYADVTAGPSFGSVVDLGAPCDATSTDNCGKPVVTPDQSMMFFATWSAGLTATDYTVNEVMLTKDATGKVTAGTSVLGHGELGTRAVSWASPDGCQVIVDDGLAGTGAFYARRTPSTTRAH